MLSDSGEMEKKGPRDMERYERYWWHPMEGWQTEKRAFWDFFREKRIVRISK